MFKHFYKTFLIAILSGSLVSFQSSVVLAAGTNTTDSKGVITNTQKHEFSQVTDTDMLASLGMLAGGFITAKMLSTYKPVTTDVMIAGAAGTAFIIGEVLSNLKFKGTIDAMTIEVSKKSDGKVNEEQIQRLQDLKISYQEAKETTETKKKLQLAAAVMFGVASATAGYMAYTEYSAMQSCMIGAIQAAKAAATPSGATCVEANVPSTSAVATTSCLSCVERISAFERAMISINNDRITPGPSVKEGRIALDQKAALAAIPKICSLPSIPKTSVAVSKALAPCATALNLQSITQIVGYPVKVGGFFNNMLERKMYVHNTKPLYENTKLSKLVTNNFVVSAFNLFFPKAEASWLPLLGLSAGVLAAFIPITTATAIEIDTFMFVPYNRSLVFAGFGAVALLAANSSDNVISQLDAYIVKIDKILNDLNKMAAGMKAQNLKQQNIAIRTVNRENQALIPFSTNNAKTECLTNNSTENCKAAADQLSSMPGFANLPDSFKNIAAQSVSLGDKLSGATGISGSTLASADALGSKKNAIAKLLENRNAAYEKLTGGKTNVKKDQDNFMNGLKARLKKTLQRQGMTATGMMASLGNSGISGAGSNAGFKADDSKKSPAVTANVVDISSKGNEKDNSLNLDFKEEATDNLAAVDMSGGAVQKASPEYVIDSNEINGQNGPTIFEVISGRYIKSGYPKLLEEEPTKK